MHHHTIVEHPSQSSVNCYEQLNCYHSYMPYLPTYWFSGAYDRRWGETKFDHDRL